MRGAERDNGRRRPIWTRGADGKIKPVDNGSIADIWAESQRVRLAEAIQEDKRRTEKRVARKATLAKMLSKVRLPKKIPLARIKKIKLSRKQYALLGGLSAVVLIAILAFSGLATGGKSGVPKTGKNGVLDIRAEKPDYNTILPGGKSIEGLGGWARVSPPDKNPVFAYVDKIDGVPITVSEQPLPESFKRDIQSSVSELAKQYTANEVVTAGTTTIYIGTSIKGPQSVILAKGGLLILIKSDAKLGHDQWTAYVDALK